MNDIGRTFNKKPNPRQNGNKTTKHIEQEVQAINRKLNKLTVKPAQSKKKKTKQGRKPSYIGSLPEPVQSMLAAGTMPFDENAKSSYIPKNVKDSHKYDVKTRVGVDLNNGCRALLCITPSPFSDAGNVVMYRETAINAFSNSLFTGAANAANTDVTVWKGVSPYTYSWPDYASAETRCVSVGVNIKHQGPLTTRSALVDIEERIGSSDPIQSTVQFTTEGVGAYITRVDNNPRVRHTPLDSKGEFTASWLNHDVGWYAQNDIAVNTLADQLSSPAYMCAGSHSRTYGNVATNIGCDAVMQLVLKNNSGQAQNFVINTIAHFERASDQFPHLNSISHEFGSEVESVMGGFFKAKQLHPDNPSDHVANSVINQIETAALERGKKKSSNLFGKAASFLSKPKNDAMLENVAFALL